MANLSQTLQTVSISDQIYQRMFKDPGSTLCCLRSKEMTSGLLAVVYSLTFIAKHLKPKTLIGLMAALVRS